MNQRLTRRTLLAATAGGIAATSLPFAAANAQDAWPTKPIKVIMPFGAGGSMDTLSRLLAPIVSETLGQQVVVENRPGATGTVTMAAVASAPADGYTLMFTGSSYSIISLLMPNLPFKMTAFTPLSRLTVGPTLLAVPAQLGIKTMAEFVAAAKKQPGKWSYGSSGIGTSVHLGGELFKMAPASTWSTSPIAPRRRSSPTSWKPPADVGAGRSRLPAVRRLGTVARAGHQLHRADAGIPRRADLRGSGLSQRPARATISASRSGPTRPRRSRRSWRKPTARPCAGRRSCSG